MIPETPSQDPRWVFQNLLNAALTGSQFLSTPTVLGSATRTALDVVARAHPDASADDIAVAYDAFDREHGHRLTTE